MKLKKIFLLFLVFFVFVNFVIAQKNITGTVTALDGESIPGVSVLLKGSSEGVMTDFEGKYSIIVPDNASFLVFSYIGMETQEVAIAGNIINCTLKESEAELEEVIIVGYGTMKKSDKTGAVSNVTAEELNTGVLTDPIQGLQGKVAGVMITKQGGDPNAGFSVKIRGAAGFGSGTQPLFVVDGVPGVDPTTIAAEDIESYNVLKDASSTAIYGARGANGIIIITTKKGSTQKGSKINFNSYLSMDKVANRLDLLNADEIRSYVDTYEIDFTDGGANTDWQNEIYQTGMSQSHNLSVSGGNNNSSYYTSLTHLNFEGVIKGTEKNRNVGRINLTQKGLNDKLTITTGLSGTVEKNNYISYGGWGTHDVLYQAFRRSPTDSVLSADGSYLESDRMFNSKNPVATINEIQNERMAKRFFSNMKADLEIIKGLVLGTNLAYIRNDQETFYFLPTYSYNSNEGFASRSYGNYDNKLAEATLKYKKTFSDIHNIDAVIGYSFQEENSDGFSAQGKNPASNLVTSNNLGVLQNVKIGDVNSYKNSARLISFFARTAYNYKNKYYGTFTLRRDGSSKFGDNKEWGLFPSVSVAWNIKKELFMEDFDFINSLKIRAGYGVTGNQDIGLYLDQTIFKPAGTAIDPETGETVVSIKGDKNENSDLQWEENKEYNFGLDFGFFNNRLTGSFDYFNKTVDHLLFQYPVPSPPNPFASVWANEGVINISGYELTLQSYVINTKNIDWKSSFTFSSFNQKVESIDGGKYSVTELHEGWVSGPGLVGGSNWTQIVRTGDELGTFYMFEDAGQLYSTGEFLFTTAAGGYAVNPSEDDRQIVGHALPDFELGWSNQLTIYNNFELNFAFRAIIGHDILNATNMIFGNPNGLMPNGNVLHSALNEKEKGLISSPTVSSYYLEKGSFLRLDNITFAYNINMNKVKYVEKLKVYISSNNTMLFTNYTGLDPEFSYDGLSFGIDQYNVYPKTRTFTFGINVTF